MAAKWNPKSVHRALTPEYLTPVADAIWVAQREASEHVQPEKGDNDWVAGCTAYQRRCFNLEKLASGPAKEWLWAGFIEGQFTIKILGFPVRVYRAPSEGDVPIKYADGSTSEMNL